MPSRRVTALLAVVVLLLATACDTGEDVEVGEGEDDGVEDPGTTDEVAEGGTLVAAISGEPDQLDPHMTSAYPSFQVLENVYDTLVQPGDPPTEAEPALAESWETSDDELTWTFSLREDVVWHDGEPFTADDVVFSFERIAEEGLNAARFDTVEDVTAVDEHTVELQLSQPTPNLLTQIGAFKGMAIVPQRIVEDGTIGQEPVGTGPFRFVSYTEGSDLELEANPDYWGEGPFVDGVEFRFISEGTVAMTNLQGGQVDWTDNVPPQDVESVLASDELESGSEPSGDFWYFAFNQNRPPFDDVEVRRALSFAVDREAVAQAAHFGAARPNQTAIPEGNPWHYDYAPFEYDLDTAEQMLADAGAEDLSVELMVTTEFEQTIQAAQVIESDWSQIGVDVSIQVLDFTEWLDRQGQGEFDALLLGWLGNIDPYDFYHLQHHSEGIFNSQGYANEEVDRLLDEASIETDEAQRKELYDQAVELIVDEVSYGFLYNPDVVAAWQPVVQDYTVRPDAAIRFETVTLDR